MSEKQTTESWNVSFNSRDKNTSEDVKCVSMNWENRSLEEICDNLNTWLVASGYGKLIVSLSTPSTNEIKSSKKEQN